MILYSCDLDCTDNFVIDVLDINASLGTKNIVRNSLLERCVSCWNDSNAILISIVAIRVVIMYSYRSI